MVDDLSYGPVAPFERDEPEALMGRRFVAYGIDLLIVFGLMILLVFAIFILGIVTLGLAWWFYAVLAPGTAILYSASTIGGTRQATIGMRLCGLKVVDGSKGGQVDGLTAAVHALLFYVATGTFILLAIDLLVGFARRDQRLGHDLLANVKVIEA